MATAWSLHSVNFGNANSCRGFDIYAWYCITNWNISIIWYDTTQYISMTWYQHDRIWCQDGVYFQWEYMISRQDISALYDVSVRYDISVWHDTTAVWYDILSQTCVTGIMTFRCLTLRCVGPSVLRCSVFGDQTMRSYERDYSYKRFRTKKSEILSRGSFSSLLMRNDTTHFRVSLIDDV